MICLTHGTQGLVDPRGHLPPETPAYRPPGCPLGHVGSMAFVVWTAGPQGGCVRTSASGIDDALAWVLALLLLALLALPLQQAGRTIWELAATGSGSG